MPPTSTTSTLAGLATSYAYRKSAPPNNRDAAPPAHTLARLTASARKWYRGPGTPEHGALIYHRMNMIERSAVELAFPSSIFITFNGSELRELFPEHLPIFYMYS